MRLLAFLATLAALAAQGATVTTAKFGDIGMDENVVTNVNLTGLVEVEAAAGMVADATNGIPEAIAGKQAALPYPTNAIPASAIDGLPPAVTNETEVWEFTGNVTPGVTYSVQYAYEAEFRWYTHWLCADGEYVDGYAGLGDPHETVEFTSSGITATYVGTRNAIGLARRSDLDGLASATSVSAANSRAASAQNAANVASNLAATADGKATTAIAYLQGDDAKVVVTNYDSAVTMPSQSLQQRIDEGGSNYWKVVWNELTRWNRFTGDGFDWAAWCGFNCFRTNILAQLDEKADRAWGYYDSHGGNYAPDGYTWISSPKIAIAAGLAYQRTVTSEGAIWVLVSNGLVTETGGNMTNGFFRISDDEGNSLFEIVKGNKRTVGAQAGSLTTTSVLGITHMHITYPVVSESHPTVKVCTNLSTADWKDETAGDCVANVEWTGSSGAWVAEVWGKTSQPMMFVNAEYEVGGETYIKNVAPISAEGGILCTDGIHKVRPVYNSGTITWEVVQ